MFGDGVIYRHQQKTKRSERDQEEKVLYEDEEPCLVAKDDLPKSWIRIQIK